MSERYVAFFSYTHFDDEHDDGLLSGVRQRIERDMQAALGRRDFEIFQDRDDLAPGDAWEARLEKALSEAVYLIPVITPSFFNSDFCRREFLRFWEKSKSDPKSARIIPLYWRTHFQLDGSLPAAADPLLEAVKAIQYDDWRTVRPHGLGHVDMRHKIEALGKDLAFRWGKRLHEETVEKEKANAEKLAVAQKAAEVSARIAGATERDDLFEIWQQHSERADEIVARLRQQGYVHISIGPPGQKTFNWLNPGESIRDLDIGPEMVLIPPGKFWMGSKEGEGGSHERPRHEVTIGTPLLVGKYALTFEEWISAQVHPEWQKHSGIAPRTPKDYGWGQGRRPVIDVSWHDAKAYCSWLSKLTDKTYRLLSEAEWEYCCRAGTETAYSFGDDPSDLGEVAWHGANSGHMTQPVGKKNANGFGLHDMHGNVWEWCENRWSLNYIGAPNDGSSGLKGGDHDRRVVRGGSWLDSPQGLRSASRGSNAAGGGDNDLGFRVARTI